MVKSNVTQMPARRRTKKERELLRRFEELQAQARETDKRIAETLRMTDELIRRLEARAAR